VSKRLRRVAPRVGLSRHLATIESYLEDYRAVCSDPSTYANEADRRHSNRDKFQKYILTSCWVKMLNRAEHWISMGVITNICYMSDTSVSDAAKYLQVGTLIQVDRELTEFLKGGLDSSSSAYITDILGYDIPRLKDRSESNDTKLEVSMEPILIVHGDEKLGDVYNYTPQMAVAFHHLLVSSLLSYVIRLQIVNKAVRAFDPISQLPYPVISAFIQLLLSTQLLFLVSHSKLFKEHSKLLNPHLLNVKEMHAATYSQRFTEMTEWHNTHHDFDRELIQKIQAMNGTSSQPRPESDQVQASAVKDSVVEASATTEESDADAGTADEVLQEQDSDSEVDVFRRWIMGLVDHFASIRVLERASGKLPAEGKINFSILGLNRPVLQISSWTTMSEEIRTLCQDSSLLSKALNNRSIPDLANKAIDIMKAKIDAYQVPTSTTVTKTSGMFEEKVYKFFKKLLSPKSPQKPLNFPGCGHCEAILMAIIHRISIKDDLDFSLKACSP
jgi:hypothetical protein